MITHPELVQLALLSEDLVVSPGQLPLQSAYLRLLARHQAGCNTDARQLDMYFRYSIGSSSSYFGLASINQKKEVR